MLKNMIIVLLLSMIAFQLYLLFEIKDAYKQSLTKCHNFVIEMNYATEHLERKIVECKRENKCH